ncbi:MAG: 3-oxoacyl-[acyl-carrier-protein] synthase III C-terminal domain-containing protein [Bacteroidota bacterium]
MGKCLPTNKVLSSDLEEKLGIPTGWAEKYSGVVERYHAKEESGAQLGAKALEEALQDAGMEFGELDMLLCGSATFDFVIPNMACLVKSEMAQGQEVDIPAINMDATCLSFVVALDMAASMLDGKRFKKIGIVSVEIASNGLNPADWETSTLFGDGAAAAIVSYEPDQESEILQAGMKTYSEGVFNTQIKGGGNSYYFRENPYDPALYSFSMNGKNLLRMANKKIPEFMQSFFGETGMCITDVDLIIPHQASRVGIHMFKRMYDFKEDQVYGNLRTHGNCIAASIPMSLYDAIKSNRLKRGQTCLISGTSAGFSIGGVLFRY